MRSIQFHMMGIINLWFFLLERCGFRYLHFLADNKQFLIDTWFGFDNRLWYLSLYLGLLLIQDLLLLLKMLLFYDLLQCLFLRVGLYLWGLSDLLLFVNCILIVSQTVGCLLLILLIFFLLLLELFITTQFLFVDFSFIIFVIFHLL